MSYKLNDLPTVNAISNNALIVVENDPDGVSTTSTVTPLVLFGNVAVNTVFTATFTASGESIFTSNTTVSNLHISYNSTPSSSTDSVNEGKIWFDEDYIYLATANNNIKRVALTSF